MRFLLCQPGPAFSVHDLYVGWCEALRELGQQVIEFDLGERLAFYDSIIIPTPTEGLFRKAVPTDEVLDLAINGLYANLVKLGDVDVLLCVSGFFMPPRALDIARARGVQVVILHTESPYEDPRQIELAAHADLNIVNDPTNIDSFPPGTRYFPHAYRPVVHHPGDPSPHLVCDLGFVGTGYPSRISFLEEMDLAGLLVKLAGNWQWLTDDSPLRPLVIHALGECLDNDQTADLYRSARVGLNLYRVEAQGNTVVTQAWAMGPREVEMAACGLFFLRDPRPEGDEVLDMLPTFSSPDEAADLVRFWLSRDGERRALADKAAAAVADRTFTANAQRLLRLLDT